MTRRRWIADQWDETSAVLLDTQAAHLARVLRAQPGQEFDLVTGNVVRRGVIEAVHGDVVRFSLHETIESAESLPLILALSIVRFERMEWAVEKLTELGVARIFPLIAERCEKHLVQAATKRAERWRRIARESAQQSRRTDIPEIADPLRLEQCLSEEPDASRLLLSEREHDQSLRDYLDSTLGDGSSPVVANALRAERIYAAIGPEGGWTEIELSQFAKHGWQQIGLGPRILRTETAAIAVASVLSAWLTA